MKLKHCLGFMSLVAMHTVTKMCEAEGKEVFSVQLDSVLDQCPLRTYLLFRAASLLPLALTGLGGGTSVVH